MPHARLILVALPFHFLLAKIDDEVTNLRGGGGGGLQLKRSSGHTNASLEYYSIAVEELESCTKFGKKLQLGCAVAKSAITIGAHELFPILVT